MSWVKLDDNFTDHQKFDGVGPLAGWLHVCGLCYCARLLTDGFIPENKARRLSSIPDEQVTALLTALVTHNLWEKVDGGFRIHDYLVYNPSAEQVKNERKAAAERQARFKKKRRSNGVTNGVSNKTPTRPDPTPVPYPVVIYERLDSKTTTDLSTVTVNVDRSYVSYIEGRQSSGRHFSREEISKLEYSQAVLGSYPDWLEELIELEAEERRHSPIGFRAKVLTEWVELGGPPSRRKMPKTKRRLTARQQREADAIALNNEVRDEIVTHMNRKEI